MEKIEKERIKGKLNQMPTDIYEKEKALLDKTERLEELKLKYSLMEANMYAQVEDEVDVKTEKKAFSNETKRKLETERRMNNSSDCVALMNEIKEARREIETEKLTVSFLKRVLKANEHIVLLG